MDAIYNYFINKNHYHGQNPSVLKILLAIEGIFMNKCKHRSLLLFLSLIMLLIPQTTYPRGTVKIPDHHRTSDVFRGTDYHHGTFSG